jgi:hypothetical protein
VRVIKRHSEGGVDRKNEISSFSIDQRGKQAVILGLDPGIQTTPFPHWIPAFAGMTGRESWIPAEVHQP